MRAWVVFAALVTIVGVGMCVRDRRGSPTSAEPTIARLGLHGLDRPPSLDEEALLALERDAREREQRFIEAIAPGHRFEATRVSAEALRRLPAATIYEIGGQLFHHRFQRSEGFGSKDRPALGRVHQGRRGGPDAYTCGDCHRKGGPAGAGTAADNAYLDGDGDRPSSALERNPPALSGAGLVELLAAEMTRELQRRRDALLAEARRTAEAQTGALEAKGISFGSLTVRPDGRLDTREVEGIGSDLVVRPFGWKGHAATVREIVEDQLAIHHGMQTRRYAEQADASIVGPFGGLDPDGDGVTDEIGEGQLDALTMFVAMQEVPQIGLPQDTEQIALWSEGQRRFEQLGCARCHVPSLPLESTSYRLEARDGGPTLTLDLARSGAEPRIAAPATPGPRRVYLFSDLKRHVVGPYLRESRRFRGISGAEVMTPRLWGVARSGPWLHDGRAPTLDRAIVEHSGEATEAARAYEALPDAERAPVRIYLTSLTRAARIMAP